jgi:hypothetical protein
MAGTTWITSTLLTRRRCSREDDYEAPTLFTPENLLREARRQIRLAEELFACGCQLIISITSAGQILPVGQPPYVVLIDKALRHEGTSYHYLPPAPYSHLERCERWLAHTGTVNWFPCMWARTGRPMRPFGRRKN